LIEGAETRSDYFLIGLTVILIEEKEVEESREYRFIEIAE
jgi:hypothetical protein